MKKQFYLLTACIMFSSLVISQNNLTMLHHLGTVQIFSGNNGFVDAYNVASSGDTIYLGGGIYNPPATISKSLVVFGAGVNLDSSSVTGTTSITGSLNFYEGADNSVYQGITAWPTFNNLDIDNFAFRYCKLTAINYYGTYVAATTCDNHQYINCQIGATNTSYADFNTIGSLIIQSSLITQFVKNIHANGFINHSVFTVGPSYSPGTGVSRPIKDVSNSIISNCKIRNIGTYYDYVITGSNNLLTHNVFNSNYSDVSNTYTSNYYVGADDNLFFVADPDGDGKYDYHLLAPGSYIGDDWSQVGLYGGDFIWKDGIMPENPHLFFSTIPQNSDESGEIIVNIKVSAQE